MGVNVGIDPGVNTGIAVGSSQGLSLLATTNFWGAVDTISMLHVKHGIGLSVYIEDPSQNKPVFNRGKVGRVAENIAQKVGSNKREGRLLIEYCQRNGIRVFAVRPTKGTMTKLKSPYFKKLTGYTVRCSQHARDAAMLIFKRKTY